MEVVVIVQKSENYAAYACSEHGRTRTNPIAF